MVEKQIEFYFSKHPQSELDCGWSRKGSSSNERSLFMANNNFKPTEGHKFRKSATAPAKRVIYLATYQDCFELNYQLQVAVRSGCKEIELRALYADYREPGYDADATIDCVQLHAFFFACNLVTTYGYHLRMQETEGYLSLGRKADKLVFVKEVRHNDVYPESSCSD